MNKASRWIPYRIALTYITFGLLWTLFFYYILPEVFGIHHRALEDVLFIGITAILIITLIKRHLESFEASRQLIVESDLKYQSLIEHNSDAILVMDMSGCFTMANPKAVSLSGYSVAELKGMHYDQLLKAEDSENGLQFLQDYFNQQTDSFTCEMIVYHKLGNALDFDVKVVPIFLNGHITGYFVIAEDITDKKRVEYEVRMAKEQLDSFVSHTTDAITVIGMAGDVLRINKAFEDMYGWLSDEVLGKSLPIVPADLKDEEQALLEQIGKGGQVNGYETVHQRKDSSRIYVSLTASPIRDAEGRVGAIAVIARDITTRIRTEQALRKSEYQYRIIVENTLNLISVLDPNGYIQYASPSHQTVLGYPTEEIENTLASARVHPDDVANIQRLFARNIGRGIACDCAFRFQHANGKWVTLEGHACPVVNDDGLVENIVVISADVTEKIHTEELLRKSDRLSVVGQLAAGVAHEIRNPLTALKGFVQLLNEVQADRDMSSQAYFDIMESELNRIEAIVSEFLWIAKPQAVSFAKRDLKMILANTVSLLESEANLNNVMICLDFGDSISYVLCEENQLKQVFINIVKNAIEAMPFGGRIWIQVRPFDADHVRIRFLDEGVGMPPERLPQLGEPFYTTKEKGTGLGLTVSFKIIQEHHGRIQVQSEPDHGTMVDVILPIDFRWQQAFHHTMDRTELPQLGTGKP